MKNLTIIIAVAGGALLFFLWKQRQRQAATQAAINALPPQSASIPPEWIAMTPAGYTVPGTTSDPFDILT